MLEKNEMIFGVRAVIEAIQAGREIDKDPCSACTRGAY